ncbi:penicillin-binding protein activator [Shewanella sp. Choline-02u-19]|uniref:penicillin-binding protein activator n=1 Tax=unclassified Shewanella TaxID=196818 RepID=UPI000C33C483|nr:MULTISPECIES: penicillin-binding protein activator [unclassified Shewanella]PKG75582.1 penicillin-binding protein activator [Shewanella sp. GutCb]PKH53982.1 penicillin-binding protein activator [Shewanella sp. Bg11-22]PKI30495.1 penicillin-binding protein activator [Shewanella sp. Choline-02u-19]
MLKRLNSTKFISIAILSAVLFGCGTSTAPVNTEKTQVSLSAVTMASSQYLALAANEKNRETRDKYVLLAAHAFINEGNANTADKTLKSIAQDMTQKPELLAEHKYLTARVLEVISTYDHALKTLDYPSTWTLPNWQWVSYYQFKARLYQQVNQPIEQVRQLSLLSQYLPPTQAYDVNNQIWRSLQPINEKTLLSFRDDRTNPIFAGWVQLAYIAKHYAINPNDLVRQLGSWQQLNPNHPAAAKLPTDLEKALNTKPYQPKNIAVLLPLTGPRAVVADTVKQGIIANYMATGDDSVAVNFFDTALGAPLAYQQAVTAGAEFIIGPLLQSEVEQLQDMPPVSAITAVTPTTASESIAAKSIPQLYLNHIDNFTAHDDKFFFALSPTDEAIDAAQRLYNDGIDQPLLLVSNDAVGHRMAESFSDAWQQLTSKPAEIHYYDAGDKMKVTVQKALGVIDSKERIARIKAILKPKIEADFRSRRDIDAIYMISASRDLVLLKPFIDVNFSVFAQPVPLYTTSRSRVESNTRETATELNNLTISDIPWLITPNTETRMVNELWPNWSNSRKRLYIMGYDALDLVGKLAQMRALPGYQFSGRSGTLSVQPDGTINRQLSWGRYQRGNLRPL